MLPRNWHSVFAPAVQARLSRARFLHSEGAMHAAMALAERFGAADPSAAGAAALLHDACKEQGPAELAETLRRARWNRCPLEPSHEALWHAWAGEVFARDELGVADKDILGAIRLHPTGHPDMTPLQAIVFLADYIEPTRSSRPDLEKVRAAARESLDEAVWLALRFKTDYLASRPGADIHPWTLAAREAIEAARRAKKRRAPAQPVAAAPCAERLSSTPA